MHIALIHLNVTTIQDIVWAKTNGDSKTLTKKASLASAK